MRFDILTLFPEMFESVFSYGIIKRALDNSIIDINSYNIRDFSEDKFNRVDDYPYGGGPGMVLQPQPIYKALKSIDIEGGTPVIYVTPAGTPFTQKKAEEFASKKRLVILSGHYEGVDERIVENCVTDEVSIGDFVMSGGEIPAMAIIDAVARLLPGVLGNLNSTCDESFNNNILEYPQYTRPYSFKGMEVPDILLSGNHAEIYKWRRQQSLERSFFRRPELIKKAILNDQDKKYISQLKRYGKEGKNGLGK